MVFIHISGERMRGGSTFKCRREVVRLKGMNFHGGVVRFLEVLLYINLSLVNHVYPASS